MEYSNELKVGAAIIIAAFAAFAGVRFFQDIPLFGSSYTLYAEFDNANGLVPGNPVRMRGVKVGSVEGVRLAPDTQLVRVQLQLEQGPRIPKGSYAQVAGISALGGVHISITPGPQDNPQLPSGGTLAPPPEQPLLQRLSDRAPALTSKADSLLTGANTTVAAVRQQFGNENSDLRRTLASIRATAGSLEELTEAEKGNIQRLIRNLEGVSSDLRAFTGENGDSLDAAVHRLNRSLDRLNRSLASLENTSATLDSVTTKLNRGDGTAGRLLNDPGLYVKMDSIAVRTNRLLLDLQENPSRYLDDMTLVKMF
jgi:phospholipid/cholesterol/gamma-HCH transport system substrate-binding protein